MFIASCGRDEQYGDLTDHPDATFDPGTTPYRGHTVADVLAMLQDPDEDQRCRAANSLFWVQQGLHGSSKFYVVPTVMERTQAGSSPRTARVGARARVIVPRLAATLRDPSWKVRVAAARALGGISVHARDAIETLRSLQDDDNAYVRLAAAEAVYEITLEPEYTLAAFTTLLGDPDPDIREQAAKRLGYMGEDGRPARAALERAQQDPAERVRDAARETLTKLR